MAALLMLHFNKPEDGDDEKKPLSPKEVQDQLLDLFKHECDDIESYRNLN
jgi:hypothetical protein